MKGVDIKSCAGTIGEMAKIEVSLLKLDETTLQRQPSFSKRRQQEKAALNPHGLLPLYRLDKGGWSG